MCVNVKKDSLVDPARSVRSRRRFPYQYHRPVSFRSAPTTRIVTTSCNQSTCIHGDCSKNGTCICHDKWTSSSCNQSSLVRKCRISSESTRWTTSFCLVHWHQEKQDVPVDLVCTILPARRWLMWLLRQPIAVIVDQVTPVGIVKLVSWMAQRLIVLSLLDEELVTSCERTPCVHGQCFKVDLFTEICVCEKNWNGVDCSQSLTRSLKFTSRFFHIHSFLPFSGSILSRVNSQSNPFHHTHANQICEESRSYVIVENWSTRLSQLAECQLRHQSNDRCHSIDDKTTDRRSLQ